MTTKTYISITIGPVYQTLGEAKKTRAVWAASYFFSWFIRRILEQSKAADFNILLPWSGEVYKGDYGAGLYTDRLFFVEDGNTTKAAITTVVDSVYNEVEELTKHVLNQPVTADFLKQYLNIHIIRTEVDEQQLGDSYTLEVLNNALDIAELKRNAPFDIEQNPLQNYFQLNPGQFSFLAADAFGAGNTTRRFHSVPEIATTTLQRGLRKQDYQNCVNKSLQNDELDFIEELKNAGFAIKPYHKYFAVLYADGDNIGKMLQQIDRQKKDIKAFSHQLLLFGKQAEQEIAAYGGNGVYVGGEDILAFLPVACVAKAGGDVSHFFIGLIKRLDECFKQTVIQFAIENQLPVPTLSYGITITYIKYPLKDSMEKAHDMMMMAKKRNGKNAVGILYRKHSGHTTQCIIQKSKLNSWALVNQLTEKYSALPGVEAENILSSIIHRFSDELFFTLFYQAAKNNRLQAFFENFFNEDVHKANGVNNVFLSEVRLFAQSVADDYCNINDCKKIIFTVLKLVHFVNSKRD